MNVSVQKYKLKNHSSKIAVVALCFVSVEAVAADEVVPEPEEIVVTGSYIRRQTLDTASPMLVMDGADLAKSGAATLGDVVQNLVINTGSQVQSDFSASAAFGTAQFNLRGLGLASTLTLVNGRRVTQNAVTPGGGFSFVDVNQFPVNMLERVEILKDGAAALYGSDAVAGVVNLITRKVDGFEIDAGYQTTTNMKNLSGKGDNTQDITINAAFGTGNDRGHLDVFFSYLHRTQVHETENFNGLLTSYNFPGAFRLLVSPASGPYAGWAAGTVVQDPDCGALGGLNPSPAGTGFCRGNLAPTSFHFIPEEKRKALFAQGRYDISDRLKVFGELSYAKYDIFVIQGETNPLVRQSVTVPSSHPDNIFGVPVVFLGRPTNTGKAVKNETTNFRSVAGAGYELGRDWYAELTYVYSQNTTNRTSIRTFVADVQAALNGVGGPGRNLRLNPFGSSVTGEGTPNDPALIDYLSRVVPLFYQSSLQTVDFHATGPLFELPGGPLSLAVGGQYRVDSLEQLVDSSILVDVDGTYAPGSNLYKTKSDVWAGFVELSIPILENLELSAALRHEKLGGGVGSTTDPKVTVRWKPIDEVTVRGSYSSSFRAPSILQTSTPLTSASANIVDRFSGTPGQCDGTAINLARVNSRGNPNLKPERSKNYNAGLAINPVQGLHASVDYWRYDYKDIIGLVSPQTIVNNDCLDDGIRNDPRVTMDPTGTVIQDVESSFFNQSRVKAVGLDFTAIYGFDIGAGNVSLGANASYILNLDLQNDALSPVIDGTGSRNHLNSLPPAPKWRGNLAAGWAMNRHNADLILRHVDSLYNDQSPVNAIGSMTTLDAQYSYSLDGVIADDVGAKLTVGMINIFDKKPPHILDNFAGFLSDVHDPRGRIAYVKLKTTF